MLGACLSWNRPCGYLPLSPLAGRRGRWDKDVNNGIHLESDAMSHESMTIMLPSTKDFLDLRDSLLMRDEIQKYCDTSRNKGRLGYLPTAILLKFNSTLS